MQFINRRVTIRIGLLMALQFWVHYPPANQARRDSSGCTVHGKFRYLLTVVIDSSARENSGRGESSSVGDPRSRL